MANLPPTRPNLMSAFSKKYYSPKNSDEFLSVTWETGYKNIQIYHNSRLVHSINSPSVLMEGIKFEDAELGKIKIRFTTERPRKLEIKVNGKKYKTVSKLNLRYDYTGPITVFTTLSVFAAIGDMLFLGFNEFNISDPIVTTVFVIDIIIITIYGVTSYLLSKRKPWVFFLGTSVFALTTAIETTSSWIVPPSLNFISLIFRFSILAYLILQARHIVKEMRIVNKSAPNTELLDEV